ncbi:MAG: crossover junction endodeoxyribonuclease RuvC [Verrucomicrobium sp.]|nr:crossover junction endodeoxyribonuclease RuvC [Verrucomicrobium sp.]
MRVLGIDPALRNTGYGIIEPGASSGSFSVVDFGVIRNGQDLLHSHCLREIYRSLREKIEAAQPEAAAVEGIIYVQSHRTAITMGAARAAALLAVADAGIPVFEYAPTRVKSAATGRGGAQKAQVGFMMRAILGLTANPPADAADALAVALTHAQSRAGLTQGIRL